MSDSNWLEKALHKVQDRVKEMGSEIGAELKRLGVQGSMELAECTIQRKCVRSLWSRSIYAFA